MRLTLCRNRLQRISDLPRHALTSSTDDFTLQFPPWRLFLGGNKCAACKLAILTNIRAAPKQHKTWSLACSDQAGEW